MTSAATARHGTPDAPLLVVRGEAELDVEPEVARIGITVGARGRDRRSTLDDLTRRNTAVLDLVKSYGRAVEELSTGAFSLTPELAERGRGERVRSYRGRVHLGAEFSDFTVLGELTTRLADLELTRVDGPWWSLRPGSPVHAEARRRAVAEAVQRAREYAEALGTTLAALTELADTGTEPSRPGLSSFARGARRMSRADASEPAEPLDLEPARLRVAAGVEARFTMAPPRL
ncbi:SIMPL domain-containing protein [Streptomyces sp. TG1A-8]|uniref:SIMPL domain-containing protein n=1 Tax=Streptomyces sp. TG1A-8 TaxID=3051385 RepID=UPI00265BE4F0|nr:SIMPL domain-containing protein [Streptomyces sp. TG1A-8]MDO0928182.1 SIMPL domain-containing protein [Streptomyces sp. TG1A-8]